MIDLEYTIKDVPVSLYSQTDKVFRLKTRVKSRITGLIKQANIHKQFNSLDYYTKFEKVFDLHIADLNNIYKRLDINTIICNDTYKRLYSEYNKYPKSIEEHSRNLFNGRFYKSKLVIKSDPLINQFIKNFKKGSINARKRDSLALLRLECQERANQGWFFVFNSLTVDNEYLSEVFDARSSAWSDYIRSVDRACALSLYNSCSDAFEARQNGDEFHSYFAVVERGHKTGRLHIHCLHIFKSLPNGCYDPNAGLIQPYRREITFLKKFWKFGHSSPIAVRFNNSDAYAKKFWRYPVVKLGSNYQPLPCKQVDALITYIGKYLTKSFDKDIQKDEVFKWRIRKSRNLGKNFLVNLVDKMTESQLLTTMISSGWNLRIRNKSLPIQKLKLLALRKLINIWKNRNFQKLSQSIQDLVPRENIVKQLVRMTKNQQSFNQLKTGDLKAIRLISSEGSSLLELIDRQADIFFGKVALKLNCSTYNGGHF